MSFFKKNNEEKETDIWKKYKNGKEQHEVGQMYTKTERCHRFYEGNQWHGAKAGGEELPVLNFIKPVVNYKVSIVAMNNTAIIYSAINGQKQAHEICDVLTKFANAQWEKSKMDSKKWEIIKKACVTGDHYMYCFDERQPSESVAADLVPKLKMRLINRTDIYFADEQNPDINEQEWIIIAERKEVDEIRRIAQQNNILKSDIDLITADDIDETVIGVEEKDEVKSRFGKCTSLLFMKKTSKGVEFCRSIKNCIYQPVQTINNLDVYPVCAMRWANKMGSARGIGVVEGMIANQLEVNKTIARRVVISKQKGFGNVVYDEDKIVDATALTKVGAAIAVKNLNANPISSMVQYLTPPPMNSDAAILQNEIISLSRELEGASDSATGQVDPTKASGEAIKAARDQSALNLNEQTAAYKQFVEDLALIWYKLIMVYSVNGIKLQDKVITQKELSQLDLNIKIDVSPTDPYSLLSREMAIENALARGHITFEEYVSVLDKTSSVPKDKFELILKARQGVQTNLQAQQQMQQPNLQNATLNDYMQGGEFNEMPQL